MRPSRRRLVASSALAPLAGLALPGCGAAPEVQRFATLKIAARAIEDLPAGWRGTGAWTLAQMLHHAAQSIEYSISGFPQPKPAWFQATAGAAAFAWFDARGRMTHSLAEPIPGAPALPADAALTPAIARVLRAIDAFDAHTGPLAPHFAYGALDKAQYTRAHLMHLANHWDEVAHA